MTRNILVTALAALLFFSPETRVFSADTGPEEPEIVLPRMILEIEWIPTEDFEPLLPPPSELVYDLASFSLPEAEALTIPEGILNPPELGELRPGGLSISGTSFYTQGTLGAGSMNSILGSLALFKTGDGPRFRALFFHEGRDGYQFHDPGTGFFHREDRIEGWTAFSGGKPEIELEGSFRETEEGLQGLSPVYSALHRYVQTRAGIQLKPREALSLGFGIHGAYAGRLLSSPDTGAVLFPRENEEYTAGTRAQAVYTQDLFVLSLAGGYRIRAVPDNGDLPFHRVGGDLGIEIYPSDRWQAEGAVGGFWNDSRGFTIPFSLGVLGSAGDLFAFTLRGGLRVEERNYFELWALSGLLRVQENLADGRTWFGAGTLEKKFLQDLLYIKAGLEVLRREEAVIIEDFENGSAVFPFRQEDILTFPLSFEAAYAPLSGLSFKASWKSFLGDRALFEPLHQAEGSIGYSPEKGRYGVTLSGSWKLPEETFLPDIRLHGFVKPREGFELVLVLEDMLSPVLEKKRFQQGPFIGPGFRVVCKTVISF
jgi:hypothetical protein